MRFALFAFLLVDENASRISTLAIQEEMANINSTEFAEEGCGSEDTWTIRFTNCNVTNSRYHCLCGLCEEGHKEFEIQGDGKATEEWCIEACREQCQ